VKGDIYKKLVKLRTPVCTSMFAVRNEGRYTKKPACQYKMAEKNGDFLS
jgi:hypothetical protein